MRAQISLKEGLDKIRAVWGIPMDVIIEEFRFFTPYKEWILENSSLPIGYGVEMALGGMQYVHEMLHTHKGETIVVMDWSRFDKGPAPWMLRDAFEIIWDSYDWSKVRTSDNKIFSVDPEHSRNRFKAIVDYFINTPIRLGDGNRYRKRGGVPSGSAFTNVIDSLINLIMVRYCVYQTTGEFPTADIVLGDDSLYVSKGMINLEEIARVADLKFGAKLNTNKSYVTTQLRNAHFLGYYSRDGMPYKAHDFLIASFCYPERTINTPVMTLARAIGQMYSTLSPTRAYPWLRIIWYLKYKYAVEFEEIHSYMRENPSRFRYLKTIGVDPTTLTVPELDETRYVDCVRPRSFPPRTYKPKRLMEKVSEVYERAKQRHSACLGREKFYIDLENCAKVPESERGTDKIDEPFQYISEEDYKALNSEEFEVE